MAIPKDIQIMPITQRNLASFYQARKGDPSGPGSNAPEVIEIEPGSLSVICRDILPARHATAYRRIPQSDIPRFQGIKSFCPFALALH